MAERNKPLEELDYGFIRENIKAVMFDVDGVVVPTGTFLRESIDGTELTIRTHKLSPEMVRIIQELKQYLWINFSSGRALLYLQIMLGDVLWDRVSLIAENGNFLLMEGEVRQLVTYDQGYFQKITDIREDLERLKEKNPEQVHGFEPKHIIVTVHTEGEMPEVREIMERHDKEGELYCLWTNEGYDIGYRKTNKATGVRFLCEKLGISPAEIITTGNQANDREMLELGVGVSVDPENVSGRYAIRKDEGRLGGRVLAEYLLRAFRT